MWAVENPDSVFYYQEHSLMDFNSQTQDDSLFTIGIQTEWQLEMMAKFGHNSALSIDATFGTNQTRVRLYPCSPCLWLCSLVILTNGLILACVILSSYLFQPCIAFILKLMFCIFPQYPLYIVMVFDDWRNGIPVAFFVISRTREQDLSPVLQALHQRVQSVNSDWNPSSIIVDNAQAEINTLG